MISTEEHGLLEAMKHAGQASASFGSKVAEYLERMGNRAAAVPGHLDRLGVETAHERVKHALERVERARETADAAAFIRHKRRIEGKRYARKVVIDEARADERAARRARKKRVRR